MSGDEDFTINTSTDNVLHGELLPNKSSHELMKAAIYRGINVSKVKNALSRYRAGNYTLFYVSVVPWEAIGRYDVAAAQEGEGGDAAKELDCYCFAVGIVC